jgi:DNA-binding CsgD family transcriptional regulator
VAAADTVARRQVAARSIEERFALDMLTAALGVALGVAAGSTVLAAVDGLGPHPARRSGVGVLLVLSCIAALWKRDAVLGALRTRPWLVVPISAFQLLAVALDELVAGPYVAFTLTSIGLAVVAARARAVWLCVALLAAGYATGVLAAHSPAELARDGNLGGTIGVMLGYPFTALVLLGLRRHLTRFIAAMDPMLEALRQGAPALTPALARAIQRPGALLPPPRVTRPRLTPREVQVVEGLAAGSAPKEIARQNGVELATVRSHIKNAKRKTGARTLRELAALTADAHWPDVAGRGR